MNSEQLFALALGLEKPWVIEKLSLTKTEGSVTGQLDIFINFERGAKFKDENGDYNPVYDSSERLWQHLNFFQHKCFIHGQVPRTIDKDKKVRTVQVPWARAGSGFTLLFEAYSMLLLESEMSVSKAADVMRVVPHRLWRVFNYWIRKAVSKDDLTAVKQVGIDETSTKKGHNYVTLIADLETKRCIHVVPGKGAETIGDFVVALEKKNGNANNINTVSMDMSPAFICGAIAHLPKAQIVFDKFHLVKMLNQSLDEVRKLERKGNELLKNHKYTVLRAYKNLKDSKKEDLVLLLESYPKLGEAYRFRELFNDMWQIGDPQEAKGYLHFWCDLVTESGIVPFKKFVNTIKAQWNGIVAYFDKEVTNGLLEGINSKVQLAKRRARGYRNIENFINMIYFLTSNLKFNYPQYPS
jgi:transposase